MKYTLYLDKSDQINPFCIVSDDGYYLWGHNIEECIEEYILRYVPKRLHFYDVEKTSYESRFMKLLEFDILDVDLIKESHPELFI